MAGEPASIGIHLTDPEIELRLNLNGADSELVEIPAGQPIQNDVTITMKWEIAHRFWSGDIDLMSALLTGKIKVEGSNMDPLFRLKSIVDQAREAYKELSKEYGWTVSIPRSRSGV
jgi:putative sterol carrier protein